MWKQHTPLVGFDWPNSSPTQIERKTLRDFAASIKDNRSREQKQRLCTINSAPIESSTAEQVHCPVLYLIEGQSTENGHHDIAGIEKFAAHKVGGIPMTTLLGAAANILFRDGLAIYRSESPEESAFFLIKALNAIRTRSTATTVHTTSHCSVLDSRLSKQFRVKSRTPRDILAAQLMQITGLGNQMAGAIATHYQTMGRLSKHVFTDGVASTVQNMAEIVVGDDTDPSNKRKRRRVGSAAASSCVNAMFATVGDFAGTDYGYPN